MPSNKTLYAYIHQEIVPFNEAFLHISDLSVQRGYGIFDYVKLQGMQPFFLDAYLDRFYESAKLMELPLDVPRETIKSAITELARLNNLDQSGVKMILTGGYSENGYDPGTPNLLILQQPLVLPDESKISRGIKVITYEYAREMAQAKTINYTTGIRLIKQIKEQAADDVLYHQKGEVLEFPRCNFFIVKQDNTVITPAEGVLQGITRRNVLQLAGKKYKTEARKVTLSDIAQAKEAFLTSTTKRILPIVQVDEHLIGDGRPGTVTLELLNDLRKMEEEYLNLTV